jgi:predicted nucleotidyltransferase
MSDPRVRREIALRAAQIMYTREESEYYTAKRKAARQVVGSDRIRDLPSNGEIRDEILLLAQMLEGDGRQRELTAMRLEALRLMRALKRFRPRLIGSVLTGHIREGSDIDIHVFTDSLGLLEDVLTELGLSYQAEHKRVHKRQEQKVFTHVHIESDYGIELTVYPLDKVSYPFKSSITGKLIERAEIGELEDLLRETVPDLEAELERAADHVEVWEMFKLLLNPLERVKQNPKYHPEGDALYHSLQVFDLARWVRGYDEEFLLAALLHDVGKGIDPQDHVAAGLEALEGLISDRTAWLIEHHMEAHEYRARTLSAGMRKRLQASEWLEDLLLLSELDQTGRKGGVDVPTVDEAVDFIRALSEDGEP